MSPPRNIIRVDHEASRTHAWRVTLQRHNEIVVRTFSDSIHGGKRKALKVAVEYREELLRRYSPYAHAIWVRTRLRRNNTSGIPGVGRYEERANPHTGYTRVFWLAFWVNEHGASRKRKFTVSRYGEEQRVGSLLDLALRQRCWRNLRPEPCQEIRPVGLGMKDRLLVVATSGDVGEGQGIPR